MPNRPPVHFKAVRFKKAKTLRDGRPMPNPLEFLVKAFSLYVISKNLDVIVLGVVTVAFLYAILKTIQNGFPRQGKDPERNRIVRLTVRWLFIVFFVIFFYLIFHEPIQEELEAFNRLEGVNRPGVVDAGLDGTPPRV